MGWWKRANGVENVATGTRTGIDKARLIDGIVSANPSACRQWLGHFDEPALRRYLAHLEHAQEPRVGTDHRQHGWKRDAETPAVVTRRKAA